MSRALPAVLVLALCFVATPAQAVFITVNFFADIGSLGTGSGSFSFDSSLIPSGGGSVGSLSGTTDLASSISFVYTDAQFGTGTHSWDSSNSGVGYLNFDSNGNLIDWQMGGDTNGIFSNPLGTPVALDFLIRSVPVTPPGSTLGPEIFAFDSGIADGSTAITGPQGLVVHWSAPEPATWLLVSVGFLGMISKRRRIGDKQ